MNPQAVRVSAVQLLLLPVIAGLAFALAGCGPGEKIASLVQGGEVRVHGEVFLVTQSAENIRLGRIEIRFFDAQTIADHVAAKSNLLKTRYAEIDGRLADNETRRLRAASAIEEAKKYSAFNSTKAGLEAFKKAEEGRRALSELEEDDKQLREMKAALYSVDFVREGLPTPLISVKTDSEGKYQVSLPKARKYTLAAAAEYRSERLFWLLDVPDADGESAELTLSNDNLYTLN